MSQYHAVQICGLGLRRTEPNVMYTRTSTKKDVAMQTYLSYSKDFRSISETYRQARRGHCQDLL